jgi:hypothetical protein
MSEFLDAAREKANAADEEHRHAWDYLHAMKPDVSEEYRRRLDAWFEARKKLHSAQDEFEIKVQEWRQSPGREDRR